jgi:predicted MFS family arabinose efflux permease
LDGTNDYWRVFLVAAISITPFITLLLYEKLPEQRVEHPAKLIESCKCVFMDADLRAIAFSNGVLQFFFHLAPFYISLYLHHVIGLPWSDLGWMFAVMLLPFVLVEYPAGYIADRWLGDKEILIGGFVLMSISFGALAFVTSSTPLYVVLIILIGTRLGSALTEAMVEGHFFRRVSSADANTLTLYRITRPLAALLAPLTASIILALTNGSYFVFFTTMGALLLVTGLGSTYFIKDSR